MPNRQPMLTDRTEKARYLKNLRAFFVVRHKLQLLIFWACRKYDMPSGRGDRLCENEGRHTVGRFLSSGKCKQPTACFVLIITTTIIRTTTTTITTTNKTITLLIVCTSLSLSLSLQPSLSVSYPLEILIKLHR